MECEEELNALRSGLQALIDDERITNAASIGIAKKVIDGGNLDALSAKQREVFERFIAPNMNIACESCGEKIQLASYPEVLANVFFEGQVLCDGCLHFKAQMLKD
jgi:hypothetical protein